MTATDEVRARHVWPVPDRTYHLWSVDNDDPGFMFVARTGRCLKELDPTADGVRKFAFIDTDADRTFEWMIRAYDWPCTPTLVVPAFTSPNKPKHGSTNSQEQTMTARRRVTSSSTLRTYLDEAGALPADSVIGHIVIFTITDTPIERDALEKEFVKAGLNPDLLPPAINPLDAFKKATSEAKDSYPIGAHVAHVMCREVKADKEIVKRQITREIQNMQKEILAYDKVIEAWFYRPKTQGGKVVKGSESVRFTPFDSGFTAEERDDVVRIAREIQDRYHQYYRYLDGNKLRGVVRDYLKFLNAISLKDSGSVYFVHSNRCDELAKLQTLVDAIGNGCYMQMFPLVDLPTQRTMIVDAFQREASSKLNDIVRDIQKLKATRATITAAAYATIMDRYKLVMEQAQEYLRTLGVTQDTTAASAELALDALKDLQHRLVNQ